MSESTGAGAREHELSATRKGGSQPSDVPKTRSRVQKLLRWLREFLRHPLTRPVSEMGILYEDLLRHAMQTQSLDDLLDVFPKRICAALELKTFHLFILEQTSPVQGVAGASEQPQVEYRLLDRSAPPMAFRASSATVARMRRERSPSAFVAATEGARAPDAWELLATREELAMLAALETQLLFPLEGRTRLIGFVSLSRAGRRPFTAAELRFLRDLGPRMGRGLETALLLRTLSEQAVAVDRAARELELARQVQAHLLPRSLPAVAGLQLAAFYQAAEQVGGDYYDCFLTVEGGLCTVIADVSGKGVSAALLMSALRASLHALMAQRGLRLPEVVGLLNSLLYEASSASRYATLFVCVYDAAAQRLEYVNAGHNPPLLLRNDGTVLRLIEGGAVIGMLAELEFESAEVELASGEVLVAYTDGITEAVNKVGLEWSEASLEAALRRTARKARGAETVLSQLRAEMEGFAKETEPVDDMTLVVLSRHGAAGESGHGSVSSLPAREP